MRWSCDHRHMVETMYEIWVAAVKGRVNSQNIATTGLGTRLNKMGGGGEEWKQSLGTLNSERFTYICSELPNPPAQIASTQAMFPRIPIQISWRQSKQVLHTLESDSFIPSALEMKLTRQMRVNVKRLKLKHSAPPQVTVAE